MLCSEFWRKGLEIAYSLLRSNPRTGCQSVIVFVTDGQDTDGENIRCGPGNYQQETGSCMIMYKCAKVIRITIEKQMVRLCIV